MIHGENCVNPEQGGTKACFHYALNIPAGESSCFRLRLRASAKASRGGDPLRTWNDRTAAQTGGRRILRCDPSAWRIPDDRLIQRQALSGMLWNKQAYLFDVNLWLDGDNPRCPPPESRKHIRNVHWRHLNSMRVLSMPDKWEYPWFASWDLGVPLRLRSRSSIRVRPRRISGCCSSSSSSTPTARFPPTNGSSRISIRPCRRGPRGGSIKSRRSAPEEATASFSREFFTSCSSISPGGSTTSTARASTSSRAASSASTTSRWSTAAPNCPTARFSSKSDATGWMGFFCLYMMRIALELAREDNVYEGLATKFFEHFIYIGAAMKKMGGRDYQLWDERGPASSTMSCAIPTATSTNSRCARSSD